MKSFNRRERDTGEGKRGFNTTTVDPGRKFAAAHDMKAKDEIERLAKEIWQAQGAVGVRGDVKAGLRSVPYSLTESAKQRTIYKAVMQLKLGIKEAMRGQLSKSASYNGQRIYTKRQPPNILIPAKN